MGSREYFLEFSEAAKKITQQPQQVEIMNGVEGFRFIK
jgi:hypothetical protein